MLEGVGRESIYLILTKCWVNLHVRFFFFSFLCVSIEDVYRYG